MVVVGAGPAGLATSHELQRRGIAHVVFERGAHVGHTWRQLYDSLTLHTGKHMSALPGMRFTRSVPLFPSRQDFVDYLDTYARTYALPVRTGLEVTNVAPVEGGWSVEAGGEIWRVRAVVIATGMFANPHRPEFPGQASFRGRVLHSSEYLRPEPFRGRRVLIVGVGNSGGEIGSELLRAGIHVTVSVRSGTLVLPRQIWGIPTQYFARLITWLSPQTQRRIVARSVRVADLWNRPPVFPRPAVPGCPRVPLLGYALVDAVRAGVVPMRGAVSSLTDAGVQFGDGRVEPFDDVLLATGYRPALGVLNNLVRRDHCGFAHRERRVKSTDQPGLFFVGQNFDTTGGLFNIARDARLAAAEIAASLASPLAGTEKRTAPARGEEPV